MAAPNFLAELLNSVPAAQKVRNRKSRALPPVSPRPCHSALKPALVCTGLANWNNCIYSDINCIILHYILIKIVVIFGAAGQVLILCNQSVASVSLKSYLFKIIYQILMLITPFHESKCDCPGF